MIKMLRIIQFEYARHVLRKRFWLSMLILPFVGLTLVVLAVVAVILAMNTTPLGYVDPAGTLGGASLTRAFAAINTSSVDILLFADEASARQALEAQKIQAYYVLPANYLQEQKARLVFIQEPDTAVKNNFRAFVRRTLLTSVPSEVAARVALGPNVTVLPTQEETQTQKNYFLTLMLPFAAGGLLFIGIIYCSNYLIGCVAEERENRTMEILASSASPSQIIHAKIIALTAVGMTPLIIWGTVPILILLNAASSNSELLTMINTGSIFRMVLFVIPTFILIVTSLATVGAAFAEPGDGQAISFIISMPIYIPAILVEYLLAHASSPAALILSYLPLTSAMTMAIRTSVEVVPLWQVASSILLQFAFAGVSLWLAARTLRWGMLRAGQPLRLKTLLRKLRKAQ